MRAPAEAEAAVKAAHDAFPAWAKRTADERAELLHKGVRHPEEPDRGPRAHPDPGERQAAGRVRAARRTSARPSCAGTPRKPAAPTARSCRARRPPSAC